MSKVMKPSTLRGLETRSRIVQATRDVLVRKGSTGFGLRSVATQAGLSLSNLQFHFRDRSTLLEALLEDEIHRGRKLVDHAPPPDLANPSGGMDRAVTALLEQQRDHDTMRLYLALWSFASTDQSVRTTLRSFYANFVNQIVLYLRQKSPHVDLKHARDKAHVAIALLEGASLFRSGVAGSFSPRVERLLRSTLLALLSLD